MFRRFFLLFWPLGSSTSKGAKEEQLETQYTVTFPKDLWELDDSYKNLMRELSKR